jgi:inner membrane protein
MIIGHFPAGYLASVVARRFGADHVVGIGILIGSVLPDVDLLRAWYLDGGGVHHHTYITHRPLFWLSVALVGFVLRTRILTGIGLGGLVHMALDSIVGEIAWGWPLTAAGTTLFFVPVTHEIWVLSFLVHWTFAVELAVLFAAIGVFLHRRKKGETF